MMGTHRCHQLCYIAISCLSIIVLLGFLQTFLWKGYSHKIAWFNQFTTSPKSVDQVNTTLQRNTVTNPHYQTLYQAELVHSHAINNKSKSKIPIDISNHTRESLWGCYNYMGNRLGASRTPPNSEVLSALNCSKREPSAILLGVKKCGSQTLTGFLDLHPDVVSEVFPSSVNTNLSIKDRDILLKKMPLSTPYETSFIDMIGFQNDPRSLAHLNNILDSYDTKYLLIFVDPVTRAHSDYVHVNIKVKLPENLKEVKRQMLPVWDKKLQQKEEPNLLFKGYRIAETFEKSVLTATGDIDKENNLIRKGIYYKYVREILKYVPRDRLLVIDGEQFISEPWVVLDQVESFLGIHPYFKKSLFVKRGKFYCPVRIERPDADCLKGKGRQKKKIQQEVKKKLKFYFQPYNRKLSKLLGETYSWM